MREIGERLRNAREKRGMTLDQIQDSTKIRRRYLEALETGEFRVIPGEVYVRGFLQNYASAVDLDPREILELYDQLRAERETPPVVQQAQETRQEESQPVVSIRKPWWSWWQPILAGSIVVVAVVLLLAGRGRSGPPPQSTVIGPAVTPGDAAETSSVSEKDEEVHLILRFTARCWLSIRCDGRMKFEGTVNSGTVQEWSAQEVVEGRFGTAGGVKAELNGVDLGYLGETGVSVTREFVGK